MSKEKYRKSETIEIQRSQINFAPYNPKNHTQEDIRAMKRNIKKVGFLGGITWNETTANLIDGHKRVMTLDLLEQYDGTPQTDYRIKVEKICLDEKTEREQNVWHTRSRTELEEELMRDLLQNYEFDYKSAGLDEFDLNLYGVDLATFEHPNVVEAIEDLYAPIKEQKAIEKEIKKELSAEEKKQKVKEAKQQIKEQAEERAKNMTAYVTLSFNDWRNKEAFMLRFGLDPEMNMIKGETFSENIERI